MALSLGARVVLRVALGTLLILALVFLTAGTWAYWQGWVFLALTNGYIGGAFFYFLKTDPQFLERRLKGQEKIREQRLVIALLKPVFFAVAALPGLDHRLGWSRGLWGELPAWTALAADVALLAGLTIVFRTMQVNRFAARTVEIKSGQTVISTGPYAWVRHPMYAGSIIMFVAMPLALGSYATLPAFALLVPMYVFRLLNEEQFLRRELPGYEEYCRQTRFRLIPNVW